MHTHFRNRSHPLRVSTITVQRILKSESICDIFPNQGIQLSEHSIIQINSVLSASLPFLLKLSAIPSFNKMPSLCILPLLNPNFQLATKSNVFSQENISLIHSLLCLLTTSTQILVFSMSYTKTVLL